MTSRLLLGGVLMFALASPAFSQDDGSGAPAPHGTGAEAVNHDATTDADGDAMPSDAAGGHAGHDMSAMNSSGGDTSMSTEAYKAAMDKMHKDMMMDYTGNPDVDFMRGMIPHHQGAIDMAKIELEYGKDPEVRKLAEEVIKAQEAEIKFMQDWLQKNDKKAD